MPAKFVGACTERPASDFEQFREFLLRYISIYFTYKHLLGNWSTMMYFFFENFACDTENADSRTKFADILQTGNGESLKFQGNFD